MKRLINIFLSVILTVSFTACEDALENGTGGAGDGSTVTIAVPFGSHDNLDIEIGTRATLPESVEKKIYNMYIYIFDANGQKIYGGFFDSNNLIAEADVANTQLDNYWTSNDSFSAGTLHITTVSSSGCTLYGITNVNADMVNISPEKLGLIQTMQGMEDLVATMNQDIVARSGYFPMSGKMTNVNTYNLAGRKLNLYRLDAKIKFNVQVGEPSVGNQPVREFIPDKWQVINVPSGAYVIEEENDVNDVPEEAVGFFDTSEVNFEETTTDGISRFSFYMLENRYVTPVEVATTQDIGSQANRSKQVKLINEDGTHRNGDWVYADKTSTYVVITGRVIMDLPVETTDGSTTEVGNILDADVRYIVHLGDFSGSKWNNFEVERNVEYTYNITIKGVDDIRVEVETNKQEFPVEGAPAATGVVTIAKENIFNCDAHYESRVIDIHDFNISTDLSWYVKTPFCDGSPIIVNGVDFPDGLDYEWVHFTLNEMDESTGLYKTERRVYNPDDCMNVIELVELLRTNKKAKVDGKEHLFDDESKISLTAFVDEYYYEVHPITKNPIDGLWRRFVNQPKRVLHILSAPEKSKDGESQAIYSAVTIQQKSIQTIYNINNENLSSAWGCEHEDENADKWGYNPDSDLVESSEYRGNKDKFNGRLNSCKEWGLSSPDENTTDFIEGVSWDNFLNTAVPNDEPILVDDYKSLRYSCLSRNRDNNGNGVIDKDEIRWYTAAIQQVLGIYMGADGIDNGARLYTKNGTKTNAHDWHQFVVSSTAFKDGTYNSNNPVVVWAEQATSTSSYAQSYGWTFGGDNFMYLYSTRCVRNLGFDDNGNDITYSGLDVLPTDYVHVEGNKDVGYRLYLDYLNEKSIRYYSSRELDYADENSMQNRLYKAFEIAPVSAAVTTTEGYDLNTANNLLSAIITENPYCPPGYRLPNQRELAMMTYYTDGIITGIHITRTYYSLGVLGKRFNGIYGFCCSSSYGEPRITLINDGTKTSRCVRDIQQ